MVDFPGVDDEDDSIGDLADLLLTIAQIVVFVVDYRYKVMHFYFPIPCLYDCGMPMQLGFALHDEL